MMSPWKTVGLHVPSSSSSAVWQCLRPKHGRVPKDSTYKASPGIYVYILVCTFLIIAYQNRNQMIMISCTNLYSSTPSRS
jgi:hypothetical protein